MKISLKNILFIVAPGVLGILLYANSFNHGYVLDDEDVISRNRIVQQGAEGIGEIWTSEYREGFLAEKGSLYRPLSLTLFALQTELKPKDAGFAHAISVLLYGLCCSLLFLWLRLMYIDKDQWLALFISMIFAAHPIHTEVVANIKSVDEILSLLFGLAALIFVLKSADSQNLIWLVPGLISFFLALVSKEGAMLLIPIIPIMLLSFRKVTFKSVFVQTVGFVLPLAAYLVLRFRAIGGIFGSEETPVLDNVLVSVNGLDRIVSAISIAFLYVVKLIYPATLSHDYSISQIEIVGLGAPTFWLGLLTVMSLAFLVWKWWKSQPILSFAILFFLITFSLYSNLFVLIGTHFGERLLFMPSIGLCIILGYLLWRQGRGKKEVFDPSSATLSLAFLGILIIMYTSKTMSRSAEWKDEMTLYTADVKSAPNSTRTHFRLGRAMNMKGIEVTDDREKVKWYNQAIAELEESVEIYSEFTDALGELGLAYQGLKRYDRAMVYNEKALKLNPNHYTTINNVGVVLFSQNKQEEARPYFKRSLEINPNFRDPAGNLGSCYGTLQQYEEAIKWFKVAIEIDPNYAPNYYFIALSFQNLNNKAESDKWLALARQIDPRIGL
jgi:tetratricopeptide (TPR) repeat protein